ncbi:hypothetical protein RHMOL_Rhmol05G0049300 [Rhododendron molle]|uniref:Uncharacterized protein n=1 Tax=Rhododendron molle TaxID=49168 RepID=A0ACC0NM40_RHOML|nr:hypothetical protein RHMOL_Rhmol05G0049300 [Rhododendron molle]
MEVAVAVGVVVLGRWWWWRRENDETEKGEGGRWLVGREGQAELLERKRLKKLQRKEQKTKGQANGEKVIAVNDDTEAQSGFSLEHSDLGTFPNAECQTAHGNESLVQTRKLIMEDEGKSLKSILLTEDVAKMDQLTSEVMIGFVSVPLGYWTSQWQDDDLIEAQGHCSTEHAILKPTEIDSVHGGSQSTVKLRRPVSWHEARGPLPVQNGKEDGITGGKDHGRMVPSETCLRSWALGDNEVDSHPPVDKSAPAEGLLLSSNAAKAFFARSMVHDLALLLNYNVNCGVIWI